MDADWRAYLELYGPTVLAELDAFTQELTPAQAERLAHLVVAVDDASAAKCHAEDERTWRQILDHVPGIALALDLVRAHVLGDVQECCEHPGSVDQRLRRPGREAEE